ncbi:MAG: DbpA RNA binding domain-containing protein, partial [Planctomycetota bacterium]
IERATKQPIEVVQPPTAEQINAHRINRFKQRLAHTVAEKELEFFQKLVQECVDESGVTMEQVAAALAHQAQKGRSFLAKELPVDSRPDRSDRDRERPERRDFNGQRDGGPRNNRSFGPPRPGMTRYRIAVGRRDNVKPGNIVGAIANEGGIDGEFIGPIRIMDSFTIVDLPEGMPQDIYQTLQRTRVGGKPLQLTEDTGPGPRRGYGNKFGNRGGRGGQGHTGGGRPNHGGRGGKSFRHKNKKRG